MAINRQAIMEDTIKRIRDAMPGETIAKYRDYGGAVDVKTVSTGSIAADIVLGGGFAEGRIVDIVGHTSAGKTTLALTACAELQRVKPDANILYVDAECALDPKYAKMLGVNMDEIYLIQPDNGEDGYLAAELFISSGVADMVIIDSIAAMIPKAMFEVNLGEQAQIGMGARLDSQGIARIFSIAHKNHTTVILINQWKKAVKVNAYDRTDGISGNYYQPGGETFKFYLSQMVEVQRVGKIYEGDQLITSQTRIRVLKNKIAPPGREADFFITFNVGVDKIQEAIELGMQSGDVIRTGRSNYQVNPLLMGFMEDPNREGVWLGPDGQPAVPPRFNGRPKFVEWLKTQPELVERIRESIKKKFLNAGNDDIHIAEGTEVQKVSPMEE